MSNFTTVVYNASMAVNKTRDATCFILDDPDDVILSHKISLFLSLFFVVVGMVGNVLSIIVFTYKTMRNVSSNTYLLMLAVSDSMYLVSVFCSTILKTMRCFYFIDTHIDISNRSNILCQLFQFFSDCFSDYSTVLILVFTIERVVAVYLPIRFKELCTVLRARIICVVMFFIISIFIGPYHFLFMGKYVDENGTEYNYCTVRGNEKVFNIMYITESLAFRILPIIAIAVLNVFIIVRVTSIAREHAKRKAVSKLNKRVKKEDKNVQLTIMLILVSTSYVLVYLPVLVHFILQHLGRSNIISINTHDMLIAQNYTSALYVSGFAINFFLYTVSGRVFREQLQVILCYNKCTRKSREHKNGYMKTGETEALTLKDNS